MASVFKPTTADVAEDMSAGSRHHGRSEQLIGDVEQAAQDLRAAVRGR